MQKLAAIVLAPFLLIAAVAAAQQAPDALRFNVPYLCSDGAIYVVHRCATGPNGEFCYYQAEGKSERYNTRDAVVYPMTKIGKVKAAAAEPTAGGASPAPSSSNLLASMEFKAD